MNRLPQVKGEWCGVSWGTEESTMSWHAVQDYRIPYGLPGSDMEWLVVYGGINRDDCFVCTRLPSHCGPLNVSGKIVIYIYTCSC